MNEEKSENKSNPVSLQTYFLEQAFLYDESVRNFLVDCRILMSLMYFDCNKASNEFFGMLSEQFNTKFTSAFVKKYEMAISASPGENIAFFVPGNPNTRTNTLLGTFRKAFLKTFEMIVKEKDFKFCPLALVTLNLGMGIRDSHTKARDLRDSANRLAIEIDSNSENKFRMAAQLKLQYDQFFEGLLKHIHLHSSENKQMQNDVKNGTMLIVAVGATLYSTDYLSGKDATIFTVVCFFLFFMARAMHLPTLNSWRKWNQDQDAFFELASSLNAIDRVKRKFYNSAGKAEEKFPVLEISYQKPEAAENSSSYLTASNSNVSVEPNKVETHPKKKTKKSIFFASDKKSEKKDAQAAQKTKAHYVIDCSHILGYPARFDSADLKGSTLFPVNAFGIKNFFQAANPSVIEEVETNDPDAADKFKKLLRENGKVLPSSSTNKQGSKYLNDFITLSNGDVVACYELKPLKEHGDKRLVGCSKSGVGKKTIDGGAPQDISCHIISYAVFAPQAHPATNLKAAVRKLERIENRERNPVEHSSEDFAFDDPVAAAL